jgi:excisionase family DNA binding protein
MNNAEGFWTKKQVAGYLNISVRAVERLLASGDLMKLKVGAATRVCVASLSAYVARNCAKGGA